MSLGIVCWPGGNVACEDGGTESDPVSAAPANEVVDDADPIAQTPDLKAASGRAGNARRWLG